jgi:4-hydroxybenzoate polyprenyltransferase
MIKKLIEISKMIKIEHTLFALPFALIGVFFAAKGTPNLKVLILCILAMFFARNSAMAFNRYADADIDKENPRTKARAIPAGKLSASFVGLFVIVNVILFFITCYFINPLAFYLSPIALFIILFYSYTKRFTAYAHIILGIGLSIAPAGGWIAVKNSISITPVFLSLAVLSWVSGFDILYSLQDEQFDREHKLYSIPVKFGAKKALNIARALHFLTVIFLICFGVFANARLWYYCGVVIGSLLLGYEHSLVKYNDLSKLDAAFFTVNSFLSVILFIFTVLNFKL